MSDAIDFAAALVAAAQKRRSVDLPELGRVYIRGLSGADVFDAADHHAALEAAGLVVNKTVKIAAGLAMVMESEAGQRLLNPSDPAHIRALLALPYESFLELVGNEAAAPEKKA